MTWKPPTAEWYCGITEPQVCPLNGQRGRTYSVIQADPFIRDLSHSQCSLLYLSSPFCQLEVVSVFTTGTVTCTPPPALQDTHLRKSKQESAKRRTCPAIEENSGTMESLEFAPLLLRKGGSDTLLTLHPQTSGKTGKYHTAPLTSRSGLSLLWMDRNTTKVFLLPVMADINLLFINSFSLCMSSTRASSFRTGILD